MVMIDSPPTWLNEGSSFTPLIAQRIDLDHLIRFDTGAAITAGQYEIGRDADGTNQLHFNVPSGAAMEWSVNDALVMALDVSGLGIGVSPTSELHIEASAPVFTVDSTNAASGLRINVLSLDASNRTLLRLQNTGATIFSVFRGGDILTTGDIDMNSAGSLLNVAASGNDWTQNAFVLAGGTATQLLHVKTTGTTTIAELRLEIGAAGGSGSFARLQWTQGSGNGDADNQAYIMDYDANAGRMRFLTQDSDGSSNSADVWRITDGQVSIDANTTWDDNVFDEYDDALVLSPYRNGLVSLAARKTELIAMGVLRQYEDGWVGYNDQRMAALLAGGIYQNRARIDAFADTIVLWQETHEDRLGRVEWEVETLRAQVVSLGAIPGA